MAGNHRIQRHRAHRGRRGTAWPLVRRRTADLCPACCRAGRRAGRLGAARPRRRALPCWAWAWAGRLTTRPRSPQATADRDAGTLLIRDAGSASDTRWLQQRGRTCPGSSVQAGTSPGSAGTSPGWPMKSSRRIWWRRSASRHGRRWLGQARRGLDRPGRRGSRARPFRQPPSKTPSRQRMTKEPGSPPIASPKGPSTTCSTPTSTASSTPPAYCRSTFPGLWTRIVPIVPTLVNIATFPDIAGRRQRNSRVRRTHGHGCGSAGRNVSRRPSKPGCGIYAGTDAGSVIKHGRIGEEMAELHDAGLPPLAVLEAATWGARRWLGAQGIANVPVPTSCVYDAIPGVHLTPFHPLRHVVLRGNIVLRRNAGL